MGLSSATASSHAYFMVASKGKRYVELFTLIEDDAVGGPDEGAEGLDATASVCAGGFCSLKEDIYGFIFF
jgi:hypothetical protein